MKKILAVAITTLMLTIPLALAESSDYHICKNNKGVPFIETDGHGEFSFSGTIIKEEGVNPWDETIKVTYLKMKIQNDTSLAFNYFKNMAEAGNTVNTLKNDELYFNLGTLEGRKIKSTAQITSKAKKRILKALNKDKTVALKMLVPLFEGSGAPPEFSFACRIGL